jgi:hypothetical protein
MRSAMQAVRNLVRRLAGALVALTLAMVVVGPSLDTAICRGESPAVSSAGFATGEQVSIFDEGGMQHPGSSPHQPCLHGHCHHNLESVPATLAEAPVSDDDGEPHAWPAPVRLAALAPSGLERPPRA